MNTDKLWDVVVVGGQAAGASLACALGPSGASVLVLQAPRHSRSTPTSCPAIFAPTMTIMDQLGVVEADYAPGAPRIRQFSIDMCGLFSTTNTFPTYGERDYVYAVNRPILDAALWRAASRWSSISLHDEVRVDRVIAGLPEMQVIASRSDGSTVRYRARCVVGADGLNSVVARSVGATASDVPRKTPTAASFAYWNGASPRNGAGPLVQFIVPRVGLLLIIAEGANGETGVTVYGRPELVAPAGVTAKEAYLTALRLSPLAQRLLSDGQQLSHPGTAYFNRAVARRPCGDGWALIGDALGDSDPLDAQGLYHALASAHSLATLLDRWLRGCIPWPALCSAYRAFVTSRIDPMKCATLRRIRHEVYGRWPKWLLNTAVRWVLTDHEYKRRFAALHVRNLHPDHWLPMPVVAAALARGLGTDLARFVLPGPTKATTPPGVGA